MSIRLLYSVKKYVVALLFYAAILFAFSANSFSQPTPVLIFNPVISSGLSSPVDVVNAGDGSNRLFIVNQGGTVRILSGGALLPGNFLDIPDSISSGGERGLLSIAFHPNFSANRYFFVYYTNNSGDLRLTRFQTQAGNPNAADENTGVVLLTIPHPSFSNHNGGKLNFGSDGNLYLGTGDGGSGGDPNNNAQNGNSLLGKMLRINVNNFTTPPYYTIPSDNPYVSDPNVRDEIFALGLRNPWRWSFDKLTQDVWIADVGQGAWEEINFRTLATSGGINYGWRCYEGNNGYNTAGCQPQSSYISPIFAYPHNITTGGFSVTGGCVYRGIEFPAMYGWYICADYVSGNVWKIRANGAGGWNIVQQSGLPGSISGFGEAENGDLYALSLSGSLYKVITSTVLPVSIQDFTATGYVVYNDIRWKTNNEQNVSYYDVEYSTDGVIYTSAGRINAINTPPSNNYTFQHFITGYAKVYYRIKITEKSGQVSYSNIVVVDKTGSPHIKIYPTLIKDNGLNIISDKPVEQILIYSAEGKKVFQNSPGYTAGIMNISLTLPALQSGLYIVRVKLKEMSFTQKIFIYQLK